MMKLSKRLQRIADCVTTGSRAADIGSDHAMLPVYLLQSGKCPTAIAGELNRGPYEAAKKQAADAGLTQRLQVRQGDGLAVLLPGEADTVTIAGMGGSLMSDILESGLLSGKLDGVKELVLQPNVGEDRVRAWLLKEHWWLQAEYILEEDSKIYEVLHAVRHPEAAEHNEALYSQSILPLELDEESRKQLYLKMGPYLLQQPDPVLIRKWASERSKLERVVRQLGESELEEARQRAEQFRSELEQLEEVLQCISTDRH
ncbi:tRNA (adenine(22)-N(1))-methyltransferase [Paenibacillus sp. GCM10023252]|uniref:tRNA (adenine(22)-N(1))-methyltransferase n=1 Tax=Paenibacillus sp. GCM10023252 TaxID=3252649 RepID=UPI0036227C7F